MNAPAAAHCSACGRELGLEPLGETGSLPCPRCENANLEMFASGPGRLLDCTLCGGQFVEHALLKDLLQQRQVYGHAVPRKPVLSPRTQPIRYIPCPTCKALMTRRNFGGNSGVIVDVCAKHGVWFDIGELPRVLAFVENGGLARTQAPSRLVQQRFRYPGRSASPVETSSLSASSGGTDLLDGLAEAATALFDLATRSVRH